LPKAKRSKVTPAWGKEPNWRTGREETGMPQAYHTTHEKRGDVRDTGGAKNKVDPLA